MFEDLDEPALLDTIRQAQRSERVAAAHRILAAGRLCQRRMRDGDTADRQQWCIDNWDSVAAEVGAELGISRGRASSQMNYGLELIERLPKLGALFASGAIDFRVMAAAVFRTGLITDADVLSATDERLANTADRWNSFSRKKLVEVIDWLVRELDPNAVRVARAADEDRHVEIGPAEHGLADIWGRVRAPDAAALDQRLDQLAATVCPDDPRTKLQRRADALAALAAGKSVMVCDCGADTCPSTLTTNEPTQIVIHLLAEANTVTGDGNTPALLPGFGAIPADTARALAANAKLRPVVTGRGLGAEPRYRPSAALAEFIRCRDLTCRFPCCDRPAEVADIDHTVPYPFGPTHPSNLKLLCRHHHLLKTFHTGQRGWADRQLPDGTVIWTSPSGRTYTTKPGAVLFFPQLFAPTEELALPDTSTLPRGPQRGLMMPTRRRTRAQERTRRMRWERGLNEARAAADPPPF
ncbi:HNH endonuclease [Mycolicibacterium sp. CH28]|uniref:HNH endonuclease signature motif containing protein n=1 Tax=Mycolicibacterium sp. CH28 TaxID=2512237 RepID=UPI001080EDDD|nr:HNH endonuclease signature motif containing protein [Mycolicibacterium sp. CH28]TGD86798.1 HNH endonuclease [Mycolicibacterium sp. CH28]